MATTQSSKLSVSISGALTNDVDIGNTKYSFSKSYSKSLSNGTGANQANMIFTDSRSTSSNDDLDLAGVLLNAFGAAITFTSIKAIMIEASAANTTNIIIGAEGTNPFSSMFGDASDTIILAPGGIFVISNPSAAGFAVTAGTGDKLRIAASSGTVAYDLVIVGEV